MFRELVCTADHQYHYKEMKNKEILLQKKNPSNKLIKFPDDIWSDRRPGLVDIAKNIYEVEGIQGFWKGNMMILGRNMVFIYAMIYANKNHLI